MLMQLTNLFFLLKVHFSEAFHFPHAKTFLFFFGNIWGQIHFLLINRHTNSYGGNFNEHNL